MIFKEARAGPVTVFWVYFGPVQRLKNTKEIIINHKESKMVKDGEDWDGLQTMKKKNIVKDDLLEK